VTRNPLYLMPSLPSCSGSSRPPLSSPVSMIKHLLNSIAVPTPCLQRALILCLTFVVVAAAGWLPAAALGQEVAPPPRSGPTLCQSLVIAQSSRKAKKWPVWIWIGIGGGAVLVVAIISAVVMRRQRPSAPQATAPDVIGGYKIQKAMATGQTSQVYEVVELASGRHFALKMLLPEKVKDPVHRQLLFHESEVGIRLAHPNIIKIIKIVKDPRNPYFVMEFFPAGNLQFRIQNKKRDFIRENAHGILKQAATALAYMNASGWVHRDVKPANIMVNSAGEVRVIDFALAQRISKRRLFRRKGQAAGTYSYMSPEQIRGQALDGRADIYSFGASVYELVTGRPPFRANTPTELLKKHLTEKPDSPQVHNPDVTDEFAELVLRMLAKKKQDRPKDFHEILMKLRSIRIFKSEVAQKTE
jgi:eukaryotic-like serine/threonine-protein kinase